MVEIFGCHGEATVVENCLDKWATAAINGTNKVLWVASYSSYLSRDKLNIAAIGNVVPHNCMCNQTLIRYKFPDPYALAQSCLGSTPAKAYETDN